MRKICFLASCCLAMCLSAYSTDRGTEKGHEWVDLGLPSGTKWATCNIGATKPEEFGDYYAWGEVAQKEVYDWDAYRYANKNSELTRYNTDRSYGINSFADGKTVLELEDDAAHFNWGGKWRMPTKAQQDELRALCYWVWTESYGGSGVKGYVVYKTKAKANKRKVSEGVYSLSDAHIFLPAAGCRVLGYLGSAGSYGYYWSSSLDADSPYDAWSVFFNSGSVSGSSNYGGRCCGQSVRAVIPGE